VTSRAMASPLACRSPIRTATSTTRGWATAGSIVDPINQQIIGYNAYTSFCAAHGTDPRCAGGAPTHAAAAACYTTAGAADPSCAAGSIANPYWNAPVQPLIDPNANFPTFDTFPGGLPGGGGYDTYGAAVRLDAGSCSTNTVRWRSLRRCSSPAARATASRSRTGASSPIPAPLGSRVRPPAILAISTGAVGGAPYDATACTQKPVDTGHLHQPVRRIGGFVAPNAIQLHTQITYDVNRRLTLVGNFANILNRCWGGTKVPFAVNQACGYTTPTIEGGGNNNIGNAYNPGWALQPQVVTPYFRCFRRFRSICTSRLG